ncbi:DUF3551 domain-containing protein [Bradyrhizobium sediminis]|uniref:DUF3551 domain-containing protein n=1 Tax=Bradyrhizobium sediminis TaxID=2840469 RepID=A0A975NW77_9BRAD|nr:DUF3551 domain-containing protein [Bradyrhizobium sediminis]
MKKNKGRRSMKSLAFLLSALVVAIGTLSASPAKADANAAFYMVGYGTTDSRDCNYHTLAQCQEACGRTRLCHCDDRLVACSLR